LSEDIISQEQKNHYLWNG